MRSGAVLVMVSGLGLTGMSSAGGAHAAALTLSDSFSINIDLDTPGSGSLDAFDPALGTLTQVDYTVATDVLIQVCSENLSTASGTTTGGPASGQLSVTYPGATVTTSSVNTALAATNLPASNGSNDCLGGFDSGSRTFPSSVGSSDTAFLSATDPNSASGTITDAAGLAPFIGPGTVDFSWEASSNADIIQPSEWDIWFVAQGDLEVTVTYTYSGPPSSTPTTTTSPPTTVPCIPPGGSTTTLPGATVPPSSTVPLCALPPTGTASNTWTLIALALVGAGGAVTALAGVRFRRRD